jgi:hypothetical protein
MCVARRLRRRGRWWRFDSIHADTDARADIDRAGTAIDHSSVEWKFDDTGEFRRRFFERYERHHGSESNASTRKPERDGDRFD